MKPVTPLRAENGLNLAVLCEQRCQWFQTCAARSSQRCRWFHFVAVIHPHWCHRFQGRRLAGAVRCLWHPSARKNSPNRCGFWVRPRKNSPCWRKSADFGVFCACWENFFPLAWPDCGMEVGPAAVPVGGGTALPPKTRMQFDWVKFQRSLKTVQFQRSAFKV